MRVFALSDIHIDFEENRRWLFGLSEYDYKDDILVLAGDITDMLPSIKKAFNALKSRFHEVFFVPGNHDLWVHRNMSKDSMENYQTIKLMAADLGIRTEPKSFGHMTIVPLLGWYDYSFGEPERELLRIWSDFTACRWPEGFDEKRITDYFIAQNEAVLGVKNDFIITFSHFLPRIDLMPFYIPASKRILYPVLGTGLLEEQVRALKSNIHIYGHSHLNMRVRRENTLYINNAFGYPYEARITLKELLSVYEF
ncbi:MAG: metallophosphoesterase [bacterium]|nr:metallophosphoesterase [bacterium]